MIMGLYRSMDRTKVQFDFVVWQESRDGWYDVVEQLGGRIYVGPKYTGKNHFAYLHWWSTFFADHPEYKVIHGHVRSTAALYLSVANRCGLVTIAHSHNTSNGAGLSAAVKNCMQLPVRYIANYLFACSNKAGAWMYGRAVLHRANYKMIPNGIDMERFAFDADRRVVMRKALHIPENVLVLGHIGRFATPKNHMWLVKLFAEWQTIRPDSRLLLVGEGALWNDVRRQCEDLGVADKVLMPGGSTEPEKYYQAMDVFVFPSLWEGLPVSVVEAQANGLPCLLSEEITREVHLTDLACALPLESISPWIEALKNFHCREGGTLTQQQRQGLAPFDVTTVAKWLEEFYCEEYEKAALKQKPSSGT